jgi:hypothetical protein
LDGLHLKCARTGPGSDFLFDRSQEQAGAGKLFPSQVFDDKLDVRSLVGITLNDRMCREKIIE